ncbi:MAG: DNA mismatch repair protein MutS, partial [Haloarculaceae archaeon]
AGGRSTFMVEMTELATILRHATEDSLVLLDEVGRGTSTADGFAIARAVTEHVHDEVGATTLFATHHHDLTALADELAGVCNLRFETDPSGDGVEFDHAVAPGAASASYGVEVAKMAGVPDPVVERSRAVLDADRGSDDDSLDGGAAAQIAAELSDLDVATMTPLEALNALAALKKELQA